MSPTLAFFANILTGLKATVAEVAYRSIPTQNALLCLVHARLCRIDKRFQRLFQRWQTNTLPPTRIRAPRPPRARKPPEIRLPTRRFWLLDILKTHLAAIRGGQIEHLLTTQEMQQFRAEVPRADRLLRPLCHMLGVTLPPAPQPATPPTRRAGEGPPRHAPQPFPTPAPTDLDGAPPPAQSYFSSA